MKKLNLLLVALIGFGISVNAQESKQDIFAVFVKGVAEFQKPVNDADKIRTSERKKTADALTEQIPEWSSMISKGEQKIKESKDTLSSVLYDMEYALTSLKKMSAFSQEYRDYLLLTDETERDVKLAAVKELFKSLCDHVESYAPPTQKSTKIGGYDKASWGDTPSEVRAKYNITDRKFHDDDGRISLTEVIPASQGKMSDRTFYFSGGKLSQVTVNYGLSLTGVLERKALMTKQDCMDVINKLTQKYGKQVKPMEQSTTNLSGFSTTVSWYYFRSAATQTTVSCKLQETTAKVFSNSPPEHSSTLLVFYEHSTPEKEKQEADKAKAKAKAKSVDL